MHRLAVIDVLNFHVELGYFVPLMLELGGDQVILYCSGEYLERNAAQITRLEAGGIEVIVDDYKRAERHRHLLADYCIRLDLADPDRPLEDRHRPLVGRLLAPADKRIVGYGHGAGHTLRQGWLKAGDYMLYLYENLMFDSVGRGSYWCDANSYPIVGVTEDGVEGAVAGLFYLENMEEYAALDKAILRQRLSDQMDAEFDPSLPLVVFFHSKTMEGQVAGSSLEKLGERANLIIKYHPVEYRIREDDRAFTKFSWPVAARGDTVFHTAEATFNDLLKYAADVNMVALSGGSLVSNLLAGLYTFPVHTPRMMAYIPEGQIYNYTVFLHNTQVFGIRLAKYIQSVDLRETEVLAARFGPGDYRALYDETVPGLRNYIFGRYRIGKPAAQAAARYIRNILQHGTMVPPELQKHAIRFRGPVQRPLKYTGQQL